MESTTRAAVPRFDAQDPAFARDPYPTYSELRSAGPLCRGGPGLWVATRHAEVSELLRDRRLGREFPAEYQSLSVGPGPAVDFLRRIIIDRDPPEHLRLRRLMTKALKPGFVRELVTPVNELLDAFIEPAADRGAFDAVADLALPVPLLLMSELLGVPRADRDEVLGRTNELAKAFAVFIPEHDRAMAHEAVVWLRAYMEDLVEQRRAAPGDDLLSRLILAEHDGRSLSHDEVVDNALFIFYAGFETTANLLAAGCDLLVRYPDQQERLRADPSLMPTAIEEFLRWDAPIHTTTRLVLEPIEIGGRTLRAGRVLVLALASANHDERAFSFPERPDIGRKPNPHVSFGGGVHLCLGAALARMESAVVFRRLLERFTLLGQAGAPHWRASRGGFRFPYYEFGRLPIEAVPA